MSPPEEIRDVSSLPAELVELSGIRAIRDPIVSLYLDLSFRDGAQPMRAMRFVELGFDEARSGRLLARVDDEAAFHRTLERVQRWVGKHLSGGRTSGAQGLALVACEGLDLFRAWELAVPIGPSLAIDEVPHLSPLAALLSEYEPVLAVRVDEAHGVIYRVAVGQVTLLDEVERISPWRFALASPGDREDSRQATMIARGHRETAARLAALAELDPRARVVLFGPERETQALLAELPEKLAGRVIGRLPLPPRSGAGPKPALLEAVQRALFAYERDRSYRRGEQVIAAWLGGLRAVAGLEDVLLAVNERHVDELVLHASFEASGFRCRSCDALGAGGDAACPYCGGQLSLLPDLKEELCRRVLASGGRIELVRGASSVEQYRGIAAFLRQDAAKPPQLGEADRHP